MPSLELTLVKETSQKLRLMKRVRVGGIVVSIAAFQAVDPGSIPGRRSFVAFLILKQNIKGKIYELSTKYV